MEEGSEQEELVEQYSFSPRINEHKPVEMRKLAQREAMEAAARDLRVRLHITRNERIENVCKSQSCMVF